MKSLFAVISIVASSASLFAAPSITRSGIVNAANYTAPSLPGGSIAQGSLFTIFGAGLGPTPYAVASAFPLPTSLGGVSVKVQVTGKTLDAIPVFVSDTQINAILPSGTPVGNALISVVYNGGTSTPQNIRVVNSSVGLFSIAGSGVGPSILQNYTTTGLPVNARSVPAQPGQTVILYGTGLGAALNADNVNPQAGDLPQKVEIFVGGKLAAKSYSGRSPCCSGLDQYAFVIPADAALGCNVPLQVRTNGNVPSNVVSLSISSDGKACTDSVQPFGAVTSGGNSGIVLLLRSNLQISFGGMTVGVTRDSLNATFRNEKGGDFAFNPVLSPPPHGSCTEYNSRGNIFASWELPGFAPSGRVLSAGTLSTFNGKKTVTAGLNGGEYQGDLGLILPVPFNSPGGFLDAPSVTVIGGGGADVGAFTATAGAVPEIQWTNASGGPFDRAADLTVNWTIPGSTADRTVIIAGGNADLFANTSGFFLCTATASANTFTVPSSVLERLTPSRSGSRGTQGAILVGLIGDRPQAPLAATGISGGALNRATLAGGLAEFK